MAVEADYLVTEVAVEETVVSGAGVHFTLDLFGCIGPRSYMIDEDFIENMLMRAVLEVGLTPVASCFHKFDGDPAETGVSGAVILQESHVSIHTWPERDFVQADVFVCNYSSDNTVKANSLVHLICGIYKPTTQRIKEVVR